MTLEEAIRQKNIPNLVGSEYIVRVQGETELGLHLYIRPSNIDGLTFDFYLNGDTIIEKFESIEKTKEELIKKRLSYQNK